MNKILALLVVAGFATAAAASPIVTLVPQADPATGLNAYMLHAEADSGDADVNAFTIVATLAHQVWPLAYGSPVKTLHLDAPMADFPAGGWGDWSPYDSYSKFIFNDYVSPGVDGCDEANDNSDPASLPDMVGQYGGAAEVGVGAALMDGAALKQEFTAQVLDIYYWVVPALTEATISGGIASPGEEATPFSFTVPEPATLSVLALGGLALLRRRGR